MDPLVPKLVLPDLDGLIENDKYSVHGDSSFYTNSCYFPIEALGKYEYNTVTYCVKYGDTDEQTHNYVKSLSGDFGLILALCMTTLR